MSSFWKAALNRAIRTVAQTLVGSAPTGFIVTKEMIQAVGIEWLWAVLAWLATGIFAGVLSLLTSIATGLPEVEHVIVKAYDDYDEDGSPITGDGNGDN